MGNLIPLLQKNVERNKHILSQNNIAVTKYFWYYIAPIYYFVYYRFVLTIYVYRGDEISNGIHNVTNNQQVEVILCSDTLYDEGAFPAFKAALNLICTASTIILMTYKKRVIRSDMHIPTYL